MQSLVVPVDKPVHYSIVRIPSETPVGIMDMATLQVEFEGRRFQLMDPPSEETPTAIDIDTGDVVQLQSPMWSSNDVEV